MQKAKDLRDQMIEIDNQIRRNWQVISDEIGDASKKVKSKEYLLGCGGTLTY